MGMVSPSRKYKNTILAAMTYYASREPNGMKARTVGAPSPNERPKTFRGEGKRVVGRYVCPATSLWSVDADDVGDTLFPDCKLSFRRALSLFGKLYA